jgi:hypothetical protein
MNKCSNMWGEGWREKVGVREMRYLLALFAKRAFVRGFVRLVILVVPECPAIGF